MSGASVLGGVTWNQSIAMLCPICKKPVDEPRPGEKAPRFLPFCSERCKLVDLGRWLGGKYQVPVEITPDDDEDAPPPPPRPPGRA